VVAARRAFSVWQCGLNAPDPVSLAEFLKAWLIAQLESAASDWRYCGRTFAAIGSLTYYAGWPTLRRHRADPQRCVTYTVREPSAWSR
jgi:hypothetical protein